MARGYKIREHEFEIAGMRALVLMPEYAETDFLDKMEARKRDRGKIDLIVHALQRIQYRGPDNCSPTLIRMLDAELCLVEVKIPGQTIRIMSYEHERGTPLAELVLLFEFIGHGGSNKIPKKDMERAKKLARIARETMEED